MSALGIVVVTYGSTPADAPAVRTLATSLRTEHEVYVVAQDNSEAPDAEREVPDVVDVLINRPDNPGLADAYATAASLLSARGIEWMMLLDQDTVVTRAYLDDVYRITTGRHTIPRDVAVLVPHLHDRQKELSPHRRVRLRTRSLSMREGVAAEWSTHLNSGSVVRISAVRRAGGFPARYPLDYLDHALAAALRQSGGQIWVLRSALDHRLSLLDRHSLSRRRLVSVLDAEFAYHVEFGSPSDVAWLALRLWLGALLSATRLRPSPDVRAELAAASRATRAVISWPPKAPRE
jgi:GT2 family glycosyltransferase